MRIRERSAARVVEIDGDFDLYSVNRPRAVLRTLVGQVEPGTAVIVDLLQCTFMDASGLGVLIAIAKIARERGVELAIVSGASVARIIEITGYKIELPTFPTLAAALSAGVQAAVTLEADAPAEVAAGA
jgi:anti-anti-sigma factor